MTLNTATATATSTSDPGRHLDEACVTVTGEIARIDGKASLLLAFTGAVLAGLAGLAGKKLPLPAQVAGGAAGLALAAAAVLLLLVVRPNLGDRGRSVREGFPLWARLDEAGIRASMNEDTRTARIKALSTIAVTKFTRLARAVDTILTALALLLVAAILAVTG
ncbi:integral membrane plasmid transfer protein [Streptomyces sp. WM4235]|uniref:Pycsar system effector family protein n=1 Tax=Streptomyces sp. WM4235 TaxID=1415551 RepID=UPI0006ADD25B|nr:Pycsar system effector family protein [Streptomyces sp. WM4235]KOU40633.1 integral membrane plasmid transfer protein [Streptomyces sp. WM4235]